MSKHFVGRLDDIRRSGGRKRVKVNGRDIFIICWSSKIFALDSFCYRKYIYLFDLSSF